MGTLDPSDGDMVCDLVRSLAYTVAAVRLEALAKVRAI